MSYPKDLEEYTLEQLRGEIERRSVCHAVDVCDYCNRKVDTPPCRFPERHKSQKATGEADAQKRIGGADAQRLTDWALTNPLVFEDVVKNLNLQIPKCEGDGKPCSNLVIYGNQVRWIGLRGAVEQQQYQLCTSCREAYTTTVQARVHATARKYNV